ncbi:MAG: heme exporter protein CcmB [Robiginitomaculum sp.]|nr:MAG: heme exporter protein CcmB [Robiginitomaculum sp.]
MHSKNIHSIGGVIIRDIRIAVRSGGAWLMGLVFFAVFLSLTAIALGGDFKTLRPLAPALIWLAVVFSLLFSFEHLFADDVRDSSLEHIKLSGMSMSAYVLAKICAHWLLCILPLILALPLAGLMLGLPEALLMGLFVSLVIASPALVCYGAFAGACLVGFRAGGFLLVVLTIPLLVPVLIFALGGVISYPEAGVLAPEFKALAGISLIATAVGIPAAAAALNTVME